MSDNQLFPEGYFIQGRELKPSDVGSKVTYVPRHADGDASHPDCEGGTIMSWNHVGVMVDYVRNKCRTDFVDLRFG